MVNKLHDDYECFFDIYLYKFINTHLSVYYKLGFTPNMVTTLSIFFGILAAYFIYAGQCNVAALMWLIAYYMDCVDGKLARQYNMVTQFGDYYDHFGDIFKYILVIFVLFQSNVRKTSDRQWIYIFVFLSILSIQIIHMGYQETVYNKDNESPMLNIIKKIVLFFDCEPEKRIHYTKYFGCGTINICFALLIIFWCK